MDEFGRIFDDSYDRVLQAKRHSMRFFDAFYDRFTKASPEIGEKFKNTNMRAQKKAIQESLKHMYAYYLNDGISDRLGEETMKHMHDVASSHSHAELDIPAWMYDTWLKCLLETVQEFDPLLDDSVLKAWKVVMTPGINFMKSNY